MTKARPIDWGFENSGHWEREGLEEERKDRE